MREKAAQPAKRGSQERRTHATGWRRRHHAPMAVNMPYQHHTTTMNAIFHGPRGEYGIIAVHHVGRLQMPTTESSTRLLANPTRIHRPDLG